MAGEGGSALVSNRTARTRSLLALEGAEEYPAAPMMVILCLIAACEGLDNCLYPSVSDALTRFEGVSLSLLAWLDTCQSVAQAIGGPFWGVQASRARLTRETILTIGTLFQGLATVIMAFSLSPYVILPLRCVNGFMLAGLRPIAMSIAGDRFDDEVRGRYFGFIQSSMMLGLSVGGILATAVSKVNIGASLGFLPDVWYGWRVAFIVVGLFTMSMAVVVRFKLRGPPVKVDAEAGKAGPGGEFQTIKTLLQKPTFLIMVTQGMFGLIPWRAFNYRTFFFQRSGLTDPQAGTANSFGGFASAAGSLLGGFIGDCLGRCWKNHGRILTAELAVYGGIPICLVTFVLSPADFGIDPMIYYSGSVIILGFVASWAPAGCNTPVLCSIADESERALVLSWQVSLEGAVGAIGPLIFLFLLQNVFGINDKCLQQDPDPQFNCGDPAEVGKAAGNALFWSSAAPWFICGLMYSALHITYPRDLAKTLVEREVAETELSAANQLQM